MREENEMTEVNVYIAKIYSIAKPEKAKEIVEIAKEYIDKLGGFEKFAEWGLF